MKTKSLRCLILPALLFCVEAAAQNYTVDWFKIASGGGTSSNNQYSVSGTIGQADASVAMSGGSYSLTGGFWSLVAAVQTTNAPLLSIVHSGNSVIVSWPSASTGFLLQQNSSVANPSGWSAFGGTINDNGTAKSVTISQPTGSVFFRLKQQ